MLARVSLRQTQARSGVVASLGARRFFADGMERVPARQQIEGASAHSFNEQGFEEFMDKHHPGAKVKGYHMMGFMLFFFGLGTIAVKNVWGENPSWTSVSRPDSKPDTAFDPVYQKYLKQEWQNIPHHAARAAEYEQ
mmetsp:Transcript_5348/g.8409  ORF Transcript_5348/g.8409 Transcript_5348/m.8409 type:complete len:137 (-) Transcript_5348:461-871(-)|eukprot:CAMPEP_0175094558 /NCGR_PEP_ID=MMETSP0086_2-20121207/3658_1 /TAXON_ID=136419 /ORGANISM="Unknown Unknown, Strain D1" /LENGTH=136 /DNA_ID=CAMNT_0016367691 /DNA_START=22 /DNA_END=432 /DNA_ORIENTATION=-